MTKIAGKKATRVPPDRGTGFMTEGTLGSNGRGMSEKEIAALRALLGSVSIRATVPVRLRPAWI